MAAPDIALLSQIREALPADMQSEGSSRTASSPILPKQVTKFMNGPSLKDQLAAMDAVYDQKEAEQEHEDADADEETPAVVTGPKRKRKSNAILSSPLSVAKEPLTNSSDGSKDDMLVNSMDEQADDTLPTSEGEEFAVRKPKSKSAASESDEARPRKKARPSIQDSSDDDEMVKSGKDHKKGDARSSITTKERLLALAKSRAAEKAALKANRAETTAMSSEEEENQARPAVKHIIKKSSNSKKKSKSKADKSGAIESLKPREFLEMQKINDELLRNRDAYIAPAIKSKRDMSTFLQKMNNALVTAPAPKIIQQRPSLPASSSANAVQLLPKSGKAMPISAPASTNLSKPISATPLEQHAAMDIDEDSYVPEHLFSQQDSYTCHIPAGPSKRRPTSSQETSSTDPIVETSFNEADSAPSKGPTIQTRPRINLEEEDEELPDANVAASADLTELKDRKEKQVLIQERSKKLADMKKAALAKAKARVETISDDDSSSSDLEVVAQAKIKVAFVEPTMTKRVPVDDPRTAIANFSKHARHRSDEIATETQFQRAGHATVHTRDQSNGRGKAKAVQLDRSTLNQNLLVKSSNQGIISMNKRKEEWYSRGGRERQVMSARTGGENKGETAKEVLAAFLADAKAGADESQADKDNDDDADDEDWNEGIELSGEEDLGSGSEIAANQSDAEVQEEEERVSEDEDQIEIDEEEQIAGSDAEQEDRDGLIEKEKTEPESVEALAEGPAANDDTLNITMDGDSPFLGDNLDLPAQGNNTILRREKSDASVTTNETLSQTQLVEEQPLPAFGKAAARFLLPKQATNAFSQFGFTQAFNDDVDAASQPFFQPKEVVATQDLFKNHKRVVNDVWRSQDALERDLEAIADEAPMLAVADGDARGIRVQTGLDMTNLLSQPLQMSPEQSQLQSPAHRFENNLETSFVTASPSPMQSQRLSLSRSPTHSIGGSARKKLRRMSSPAVDAQEEVGSDTAEQEDDNASETEDAPANAFDVLAANARKHEKAADRSEKGKRPKTKNNMFVDDQANESDEDVRFGGGLMGTNRRGDGDEDEGSDDDASVVADLVDDVNVDASLQAEQDKLAQAKYREDEAMEDARRLKDVKKTTEGLWRQRRSGADVLSDSDYSDDEYGKSRGRQAYKDKKRILNGKDEMDSIALNPETLAFAESYRETHEVNGKGEDYDFLQVEALEDSDSDDDGDAEMARARKKAQRIQELDEQMRLAKEAADNHGSLNTSSSPRFSLAGRVKDRTAVGMPVAQRRLNQADDFADLEVEYKKHERLETAHQKAVRQQESLLEVRRQDSYSKRAGASSSITNMTNRAMHTVQQKRSVSTPVLAGALKLQQQARGQLQQTKSLSTVRQAGFKRS